MRLAALWLGAGLLGSCSFALGVLESMFASSCGNQTVDSLPSPDGSRRAVVYGRDCGDTAKVSTHISILDKGEALPDEPGNAWQGEGASTRHVCGTRVVNVGVRWEGPEALRIAYDSAGARTSRHFPRAHGVHVLVEPSQGTAP